MNRVDNLIVYYTMSYPEAILQVFKVCFEHVYFNRFIDYVICKKFGPNYYFDVKGHKVKPLISGILEDCKTGEKFFSLAAFYNSIHGSAIEPFNPEIFHHIYFREKYNLHRLLCMLSDDDMIHFKDEKYRVFCMYRDLRDRVKYYYPSLKDMGNSKSRYILEWNGTQFKISINELTELSKGRTDKCLELLSEYENENVNELWFNKPDTDEYYNLCP